MRARFVLGTLLVVTAATAAPSARADVPRDPETMVGNDCARARAVGKTCELTIEEESIEGGRPTVGETEVAIAAFFQHTSLINLRRDFIPEMLKTADDL